MKYETPHTKSARSQRQVSNTALSFPPHFFLHGGGKWYVCYQFLSCLKTITYYLPKYITNTGFAYGVSVSNQLPLSGLPLTRHSVTGIHILLLEYSEWTQKEFPHEHMKCSQVNVTSDLRHVLKVFTAMTHSWSSFFEVTIVFCSVISAKPLKYRIWEQICLDHPTPRSLLPLHWVHVYSHWVVIKHLE